MLTIGILLFCLLAACNSKKQAPEPEVSEQSRSIEGPSKELSAIDSLMWRQPDSALACLLPYFDTCCRDAIIASPETPRGDSIETHAMRLYNRHYAHLLLAELLYKNDYAQTNRPELMEAVVYFDSLLMLADTRGVSLQGSRRRDASHASAQNVSATTAAFLDARAHYINGVGYYEQDSVVPACMEYLKALEVMEEHFDDKALMGHKARFIALTHGRLGELFNEQLMAEPAITCYKQALLYCKRETTSIYGIPVLLYNLGIQFDVANQKDSAVFYYGKALASLPDFDNIHYRDIITSKALLAYNNGECMDSVIKSFEYVISLASDDNERTTRFLTLGNILFDDNQYDSARIYLENVFEQQKDIRSKILAAENLCDIYQMKGDSIKARQYASFLADYTMAEIEKNTDVSKINELFKNHVNQKQKIQAEKERKEAVRKVIGIIVPIAVIIVLFITIFAKLRAKRRLRDKEKNYQQEMETERQTHKMRQAAISSRLRRSNQEVRELQEHIRQMDNLAPKNETVSSFNEEPICRLIMERVRDGQFKSKIDCNIYKSYALDKQQLLDLRIAADRHFSQFTLRLRKAYPKLTNIDIDYCCLYLLNLTHADISALMQRAYNTVVERDSKIQKTIGREEPLPVSLMDIALNPSSI